MKTSYSSKCPKILYTTKYNLLSSERTASQIARSIIELALTLKSEDNKILISLIVPRSDNLNNKANEVNSHLIHMRAERNIPYIDHTNSVQPENYLNESKLHFNRYGTMAFANSISKLSLNIIDGIMIVAILIICLKKTLTKSRKVVHNIQTKKTIRVLVILLRILF